MCNNSKILRLTDTVVRYRELGEVENVCTSHNIIVSSLPSCC